METTLFDGFDKLGAAGIVAVINPTGIVVAVVWAITSAEKRAETDSTKAAEIEREQMECFIEGRFLACLCGQAVRSAREKNINCRSFASSVLIEDSERTSGQPCPAGQEHNGFRGHRTMLCCVSLL